MSALWSPFVNALTPYIPGEQPQNSAQWIKLNTNENPYSASDKVMSAIHGISQDSLRRYPDPESTGLRVALSEYYGLSQEQVFVGNGSDEVLSHAFNAFFRQKGPLGFPDITYSFYEVYCRFYGIEPYLIALNDDFSLDIDLFLSNLGGVVIANPNAPTGIAIEKDKVVYLLKKHANAVVLVDEAYVDFGAESAVSLINDFPNLLVVQTFSKSRALAGLRVGYAMGSTHLIEALNRVKNSFNSYPLSCFAQAGAVASLCDKEWFKNITQQVVSSREHLINQLQALAFEVLPSQANFVFARHATHSAKDIEAYLRNHHVLVRHFASPRIENFLRISIGKDDDLQRLIQLLKKYLIP